MWIKEREYNELKEHKAMRFELEKEVHRLANMLSAQVGDCKVGPWCDGCVHKGVDHSEVVDMNTFSGPWVTVAGKVQFCKKHLHSLCPEFEGKKLSQS